LRWDIAYSIAVIASYAIIIPHGAKPFSMQRISGMYVTTGRVTFLQADDLHFVVNFLRTPQWMEQYQTGMGLDGESNSLQNSADTSLPC